jgi:HD-GYP domain-containing protein (c-di-GMP phosphodiesterase class II)
MAAPYTAVSTEDDSYVAVETSRFAEGSSLPFDVWMKEGNRLVPLFLRGTLYDFAARAVLVEKGIGTVYTRKSDARSLERYLTQQASPYDAPPPPPREGSRYESLKERHFPIDRSLLIAGASIPFSLFSLTTEGVQTLLAATDRSPAPVDDAVLRAEGEVVVRSEDLPRYQAYLDALLAGSKGGKDREKIQRIAIRENSKVLIKGLLDDPRSGEKIKDSIAAVSGMVDCILQNRDAISDLLSLKTYDAYTYAHSVNVAVMAVGLGIAMGLERSKVERLGIGAMLHDIGKSAIPHAILNKTGRLTDQEYEVMKTHVVEGEKLLRVHRQIPEDSLTTVVQHHERLLGTGYPAGTKGSAITLFGRIASLIDCYDALTTQRSYQAARTPYFALSIITRVQGEYDPEIVKLFITTLGEISA